MTFVALVTLALVSASSCSSRGSGGEHEARGAKTAAADALDWAGFRETSGLRPLGFDQVWGIDRLVKFALHGAADDVDRALAAAGVTAPATPGLAVFQVPLPGFDLAALQNPRTIEDRWTHPSGQTIHRRLVRGASEGDDVIHVWAFTT